MSEHTERERMGIREVWSNKISREELSAGDHIYSWRGSSHLYAHHGIYNAAEGKVIHFTRGGGEEIGIPTVDRVSASSAAPTSRSSRHSDKPCPVCQYHSGLGGGVISSCIDCFLSGGELYLYQYGVSWGFYKAKRRGTCSRKASDPPNIVLARAQSFLRDGFGDYHIVNNNCENFAVTCKTDEGVGSPTGQAKFALKISSSAQNFLGKRFSSINMPRPAN